MGSGAADASARAGFEVSTVSGSPEEVADILRGLAHAGYSQVMIWLDSLRAIEALAPVLEGLDQG